MAMMGDKTIFLDTNVLVYASIKESPFNQVARKKLQQLYDEEIQIWISQQILKEFLVTLSRPQQFSEPIIKNELIMLSRQYASSFVVARDNSNVMENLLTLIHEAPVGGKQIHDANIVATMQAYEIPNLLTHNTKDFQRFSQWINVLSLIPDPQNQKEET